MAPHSFFLHSERTEQWQRQPFCAWVAPPHTHTPSTSMRTRAYFRPRLKCWVNKERVGTGARTVFWQEKTSRPMHDKWVCHAYCWARAETCPAHPFGEHGTSQFDYKDPLAAAAAASPPHPLLPVSGKGSRELSWFGSKEERRTEAMKGRVARVTGNYGRKRWNEEQLPGREGKREMGSRGK